MIKFDYKKYYCVQLYYMFVDVDVDVDVDHMFDFPEYRFGEIITISFFFNEGRHIPDPMCIVCTTAHVQ